MQPADREPGRTDATTLIMLANAGLVGVPAAYATSGSVLVTIVAALAAAAMVAVHLARRRPKS
ncbi:hypothetical protein [Catenuloplanes atrovinosus]|uniref:Membrane protein n=1 Tax=Catenuloplanes atrovinosus TaxID=137266 RepID=A0AAE3YKA3_9ACTN|nr:hypothetical protein [Catenuloplanes atrovinosus]MDR7274477.1 putative membrane protein [Catenuloplanes atrovinosus]